MHEHLRHKKLFLLDMDGTIYLGDRLFPCALPFLGQVERMGAQYMFLTNNSSKSAALYLEKLARMHIPVPPGHLLTSTHATAAHLHKAYGNQPIYASGTQAFVRELSDLGIHVTDDIEAPIAALVMGFDTELDFHKLDTMCLLLGKGLDYIATNPDLVCPTEYGYVPDCGSVAQMLKNATGREPLFIGKPMTAMVDMALAQAGASKGETLMIGDRLYTDIACGVNAGIETALVLSGESKEGDIKSSAHKPDHVFTDLDQLLAILEGNDGSKNL